MRVLTDGPTATEAVGMVLALDAHLTQEAERLAATGALEAAEAPATPEAAAAAREQVISAVAAVAETPLRSRRSCRARSEASVASPMAVPIAAPLTAPARCRRPLPACRRWPRRPSPSR